MEESHIYTLLNCIFESGIPTTIQRNELQEIDYLTQVSFEVWERTSTTSATSVMSPLQTNLPTLSTFSPPSSRIPTNSLPTVPVIPLPPSIIPAPTISSPSGTSTPTTTMSTSSNYSLRIGFSPGCAVSDSLDIQLDSKHCINVAQRRPLTNHLDVDVIRQLLEKKFDRVELPKRFLPISIRGEVERGLSSVPRASDISEDTNDVGSTFKIEVNAVQS